MEDVFGSLITISICVVLPLGIVWLNRRVVTNRENKRAEVMMEVLRTNSSIEIKDLMKYLENPDSSTGKINVVYRCLQWGVTFTLFGLMILSSFFLIDYNKILKNIFLLLCGLCLSVGIGNFVVFFLMQRDRRVSEKKKEMD